jgi:hypothetical protein
MDKDLDKILKRAKRGEPEIPKPEAPVKVFPKNKPYDHLVFTKLVKFTGFHPIIFLFVFPAALCVGFLFDGFARETIYSLLIYGAIIVVYLIINQIRFWFRFKGWKERLPFEVHGWNEMIHEKKMFCDLCWNDTRLEVHLTQESPEILELIQAALSIFIKRSEMAFYNKKTGSSSTRHRQSWKLVSPTVAEGSANPEVMRYMKDVFERELSTIARKTGKIKDVRVSLLSEEFQILIHIETGNT